MKKAETEKLAAGFAAVVGGKPAKTPLGETLVLPGEKLAKAVAKEWEKQGKKINKDTMPLTQIACIAIDLARAKREALCDDILSYSDTDLVCYRAGGMPELLTLQQELDPLIAWAEKKFGITLQTTDGLMPITQDPKNRQKLMKAITSYNEWQLALLASAVKPLSSLVLALALLEKKISAPEAFRLAHLEETYQTRKWGEDSEKEQKIRARETEILGVGEFLRLLAQ